MILLCPGCGHHAEVKLKRGARIRCSVCGAVTAKKITRVKVWTKWPEVRPPPRARIDTHAGLIYYGEGKGYKPGWASWRYRAIYASWPPRELPEPIPPYHELLAWIVSDDNKRKAERRKQALINPGANGNEPLHHVVSTSILMSEDDWGVDL